MSEELNENPLTDYSTRQLKEEIKRRREEKAVLIIDMPESCAECPFNSWLNVCKLKQRLEKAWLCHFYLTDPQVKNGGRPSWCPLCKLPEKKEEKPEGVFELTYNEGWNTCLDEITR